ncbi:MAG: Tk-subtilisin precursor [Methanosaeta sp. PtaU1.Bin112]|nr:MAG: Tk-subtilisin precursor [Methanosaeta sp. PtaU1.Bin112]
MNSSSIAYFILLAGLLSCAAAFPVQNALDNNKASIWFEKEYRSYFKPDADDGLPPVIYGVSVSPSALKVGSPRSEINAFVHDAGSIDMVYADIGNRMNLMLDLNQDSRYTGYCGSNLPPGVYKVTIVAIDKAGNAAKDESATLAIRDPNDLNSNGIEDSLEKQGGKDLKVIVLHDGNLSDVSSAEDRFHILPGSAMTVSGDKLEKIAKINGVKGIYKDQKLRVLALAAETDGPSAVQSASHPSQDGSWNIDDPRMDKGYTGEGVTVALIDTGADHDHESLAGRIVAFRDFVNNQTDSYDDNGHGTHCASLVAGEKGTGVAPGAKLVVIKVMDKEGACYLSDALNALDWCLENKERYGIRVVSFSVGGESPSDGPSLLDEACNKMVENGLVMCVAAGNSGPAASSIVIPGDAENVITVGAVDRSGNIFELSSRGPTAEGETKPDLVTMGVNVVSALAGSKNGRSSISGTSMAVPQVSGAVALLLQAKPDLAPADVKRVLLKTADDLGPSGQDNVYGYGALNLTCALQSISALRPGLSPPNLEGAQLNRKEASVGEPVMIEAQALGDIRTINANIIGPDRTMEIPLDDFDGNGVFSARWETSFWTPGDYQVKVDLLGKFGEMDEKIVPFRLLEKE